MPLLVNLTTKIGSGATPRGGKNAYKGGDFSLIRSQNVLDFSFSYGGLVKINNEQANALSNVEVQIGDVLLNITGDSVARCCQVDPACLPARVNQHVCIIRPNPQLLDSIFLKYFLLETNQKQYLLTLASAGATRNALTKVMVQELEIPDIDVSQQKAIAHILGTLDDKIELNQKINQTLEEIAKAIFKSWFVDFDPVRAKAEGRPTGLPPEISDLFPDELVDSEIGEIPKGWKIKRVEEICEKIAMGPFGSNIKVSTFVDDGIPIISGHHLHNFLLREGDHKFITEEHAERLKNSLVRSGDVIFTHAGTLGQVSLIPDDSDYETYVISQRQFYARPLRPEHSAYLNFFFHSPVGQHKLLSNVSGSGVPSIARPSSHLKSIELTLADEHLVRKFDQLVSPMVERMVLVSREIETLAELRDTLLPKLISGELRIPDAEKFLEAAGI